MSLRHTDGPMWKPEPAPKKKRKGLARVSEKRKAVNVERAAFAKEQLAKRLKCEAGPLIGPHLGKQILKSIPRWVHCLVGTTELHEPLTRARAPGVETILDVKNSVAICPACHRWVHEHPAEAERIGLLKSSRGL